MEGKKQVMDSKFWLIDIVGILFSAIVSVVLSNLGLAIHTAICISLILLLIIVLVQLGVKCKEIKAKLEKLEKRLSKDGDNVLSDNEDGNNLLFMALTQDLAEPLRISLLEKSANKYNNILSALILGNIYEYGVEKDGIVLLNGDKEKAFEIYKSIEKFDDYGVSHWMIGWYYQNSFVAEAKKLGENKRLAKAREYFEISKKKGFPKAMNSLGNFIIYEHAGFNIKKDSGDMIAYYKAASEKGDNYATLNYGHYYL